MKKKIFYIAKEPQKLKLKDSHTIPEVKYFINSLELNNKKKSKSSLIKKSKSSKTLSNLNINRKASQQSFNDLDDLEFSPLSLSKRASSLTLKNIAIQNEDEPNFDGIVTLSVRLNYSYQSQYYLFKISVRTRFNDKGKEEFLLNDIISGIETYKPCDDFFLEENKVAVSISTEVNDIYMYLGIYPFPKGKYYFMDVPKNHTISLKFRQILPANFSIVYDLYEMEKEREPSKEDDDTTENVPTDVGNSKRAREKKIGFVVKKVFEWKKLREMTQNSMSLVDAAYGVGLSKKTLDEYLNQIKAGYENNFDFNKHYNGKINILRTFNKKMSGEFGDDNDELSLEENAENNEFDLTMKEKTKTESSFRRPMRVSRLEEAKELKPKNSSKSLKTLGKLRNYNKSKSNINLELKGKSVSGFSVNVKTIRNKRKIHKLKEDLTNKKYLGKKATRKKK